MFYPPEPPSQALVHMTESRYGFSSVDLDLTDEDITLFDSMEISSPLSYHVYGSLSDFAGALAPMLSAFGENDESIVEPLTERVVQIAQEVLAVSGQNFAWFYLRSSLPPEQMPLKRWHMDGTHFLTDGIQYKFCYTIQGDSTLFYPLSRELIQTRQVVWLHMNDVKFTNEFCQKELVYTPGRKEGIFFMLARPEYAALHVEPPIVKPRLFFSIVPCKKEQLSQIRGRIQFYYPPSEKEIYLLF